MQGCPRMRSGRPSQSLTDARCGCPIESTAVRRLSSELFREGPEARSSIPRERTRLNRDARAHRQILVYAADASMP
jgi:hypothetical protein